MAKMEYEGQMALPKSSYLPSFVGMTEDHWCLFFLQFEHLKTSSNWYLSPVSMSVVLFIQKEKSPMAYDAQTASSQLLPPTISYNPWLPSSYFKAMTAVILSLVAYSLQSLSYLF